MSDLKVKSEFLKILIERGFMHQCTNLEGLDDYLSKRSGCAYIGFDATADSLHIGSLIQIMLLRHFQKSGHRPIVLMGGGTTRIGDPSGKDESRKLLTDEVIADNIKGIGSIFSKYLNFGSGKHDAIMVNNATWLDSLNYIDLLRDIGPHFTINRMVTFDSVKLRLEREQPLTFLEFNYMILQAYDFMELAKTEKCYLQMGGADQWGNIVNGIDLTRRILQTEVFGLTSPLITTASGAKMGKTAQGAIWLNADRCSPYDYWQFWRNTEDADVGRFLRLFTELPLDEIQKLEALQGSDINAAKIVLANEATALCHGKAEAEKAFATAQQTFIEGVLSENLPHITLSAAALHAGIPFVDCLVDLKLCTSKGEARRLIDGGGARLNDTVVTDRELMIRLNDFNGNESMKISAGKKKHGLVKQGD